MTQFTLARSRTYITLGQEIGRGGEGSVYSIKDNNSQVAKVYSSSPEQKKIQKLILMAEAADASLTQIAAWPLDVLLDQQGNARGFLMPRIDARRDIHELYSPKSRAEAFPQIDFRFLVHVGGNIGRVFAVLHAKGYVLGDINHSNLLVGPDGTVRLIDCDSIQVRYGSYVFTCDVGSPLFTAPELQGSHFRGLERTQNHDRFGLAILLFHLLFMGRHPFAGKYSGPGEMPIERAITQYRFAYGPDRSRNSMERPPATLPLEYLGPSIAQLFNKAFSRLPPGGNRPEAKSWIDELEKLKGSLRSCPVAEWHHYPNWLSTCPWCSLEAQTGIRLFGKQIFSGGLTGTVDLEELWKAIHRVPCPAATPPLPSDRPWEPPSTYKKPNTNFRSFLSIVLVFVGLSTCNALSTKNGGLILLVPPILFYLCAFLAWPRIDQEKTRIAEQAYFAAKNEWEALLRRWHREASYFIFENKLKELEAFHNELKNLPHKRQKRLNELAAQREVRQKQLYLDRFSIDRAKIPQIGPSRTAMLASYGIETAADIDERKILQIPGFGSVITSELLQWRREHERNFRFNPALGIDQRDIDALDQELEGRKRNLFSKLKEGPSFLSQLSHNITTARSRLLPIMESKWNELKMAELNRIVYK